MTAYRQLLADEWGMEWARDPVPERLADPEVFVHHSAGNRGGEDGPAAFRNLQRYVIDSKGYSAVDYDMLVHYDPVGDVVTIGEARGPWLSAATRNRNEQGEAVCLLGMFHPGYSWSTRPTDAEIEGVARAIAWSIRLGHTAPDADILGHRDNPAHPLDTVCPGDWMQAELPTIRRRVAELLAPDPGPTPEPTPTPEPPTEDDMPRYITLGDPPTPVFELHNHRLAVWVDAERWATLADDGAEVEQLGPPAASRMVLVGTIDDDNPRWHSVRDMFGQVISA